ncbi:hypothetical protein [Acerihabitans arboris]|uniref:hypothetical protein n=1 Tax=Acerihabitans arboris TaxID=2691583 RepID=UPI001390DBD6|nr:hypothetical protein [Acerihabitans arboris]
MGNRKAVTAGADTAAATIILRETTGKKKPAPMLAKNNTGSNVSNVVLSTGKRGLPSVSQAMIMVITIACKALC